MIIITYFMFNVYTSNETIGSPSAMFDLLQEAAIKRPVPGNHEGSYMTLKSNFALIFGVIQLCSGSGMSEILDHTYARKDCILITAKVPCSWIKRTGKEP